MSIKDVIDIIKEYGLFILENWYIFAIWTVICVTATSLVFKALGKKQKEKTTTLTSKLETLRTQKETELETLTKQKDSEITNLSNELESLKLQLKEQKGCYETLEKEAWLAAPRVTVDSPSARGVSEAMQKKYKK